jgi:hypothetical protein
VAVVALAGHHAGRDIKVREQGRGAAGDVVVVAFCGGPGRMGRNGAVRCRACSLDLSSTQSTMVFFGGDGHRCCIGLPLRYKE